MAETGSQKAWLAASKRHLSERHGRLTWDEFADLAGIAPRAMKSYRMPEVSADYRQMPDLARREIERLVREAAGAMGSPDVLSPAPTAGVDVLAAVAALVVRQASQCVIDGRMVSGTNRTRWAPVGLGAEDRRAMAIVSRAALVAGLPDHGAEIHHLLYQCTRPLWQWLPIAQVKAMGLEDTPLIHAEEGIPTPECQDLAQGFTGATANLEEQIFNRFKEELDRLSKDSAAACYTQVREFVVRHPVCETVDLRRAGEELPVQVWLILQRDFYEPVPESWRSGDGVPICAHCGNAMRRGDAGLVCRTAACAFTLRTEQARSVPSSDLWRVRRGIKQYWVEPGFDEVRLYDKMRQAGFEAELYPHRDRVDIASREIGMDLKAYKSPETLARHFRSSVGGLSFYRHKWVVIPDWIASITPSYIERVRRGADRAELQFLTASDALARLHRGSAHA